MYLRAISIGYAVPRVDFDAAVHSVFHSAINLKPKGEDRLLTLLASGETDLPQGIRLDTPNEFSFEECPVGSRGTCREGILNLEGFPLTIDLRTAKCWDCRLLTLNANMNDPAVINAWRGAWQALNERQARCGSEFIARDLLLQTSKKPALAQQISRALQNVLSATRRCNLSGQNGIGELIGLGSGLTPSGDDILIGYPAGLRCSVGGNRERLNFLLAFCEAVKRLSKGTNDISRTYLYHAAHGHVSSKLADLTRAICTGSNPDQVLACTESAMQAGHTSGMDTVSGLLLGLVVWTDITEIPTG